MTDINQSLEKFQEARNSIEVQKSIPLNFDLGILTAGDINTLDNNKFRKLDDKLDNYLKDVSRGGVQLLINEIFKLPVINTELGYMAKLPKPLLSIPREKPVPKPKPMTRWEKFAKAKGITNKKRERMIFDEESGTYKPRYGYKGINQVTDDWLLEVPEGAPMDHDMYAEARADKKKRVQDNQRKQERNLREASNRPDEITDPSLASDKLSNVQKRHKAKQAQQKEEATQRRAKQTERKENLQRDAVLAKTSTASLGKFDTTIQGEAKAKGVKRQFEQTTAPDLGKEKESTLKVISKLTDGSAAKAKQKKEVVNTRKAMKQVRFQLPDKKAKGNGKKKSK